MNLNYLKRFDNYQQILCNQMLQKYILHLS